MSTNVLKIRDSKIVIRQGNALKIASPGPQGAKGDAGDLTAYIHTQGSAATTWTINHNRGYKPAVTIFSAGGLEIEAEVVHVSNNQVQVLFVTATAGSARLI